MITGWAVGEPEPSTSSAYINKEKWQERGVGSFQNSKNPLRLHYQNLTSDIIEKKMTFICASLINPVKLAWKGMDLDIVQLWKAGFLAQNQCN